MGIRCRSITATAAWLRRLEARSSCNSGFRSVSKAAASTAAAATSRRSDFCSVGTKGAASATSASHCRSTTGKGSSGARLELRDPAELRRRPPDVRSEHRSAPESDWFPVHHYACITGRIHPVWAKTCVSRAKHWLLAGDEDLPRNPDRSDRDARVGCCGAKVQAVPLRTEFSAWKCAYILAGTCR